MIACEYGHEDIVKLLLDLSTKDEIYFNVKDNEGRTAFMLACQKRQVKVVKMLLDYSPRKDINLETIDTREMTPLMLAIENEHYEVFRLLLDHAERKDVDYDLFKHNAFTLACTLGQTEMVKALLDHPQSIKLQINEIGNGTTLFMYGFLAATRHSQVDVVNLLLYHHKTQTINWNAWDGETGSGPLFLRICEFIHSKEILKLILDHSNFDLNVRGKFGRTGFMVACCLNANQEIIELVMQNSVRCNINLNAKDERGYTIFMWACGKGFIDLVQILLGNAPNTHIDF